VIANNTSRSASVRITCPCVDFTAPDYITLPFDCIDI